jgi:subtilisin family serine protease
VRLLVQGFEIRFISYLPVGLGLDVCGLRRRFWAALVFFVLLAALAAPLWGFFSDVTDGSGDLAGRELPIMVKSEASRRVGLAGAYVPGEVLVKFVPGASEDKIRGLRLGQGVEELSVSPFSDVRRWRVPASRTVEEWAALFSGNPLVEYAEPNYYAYSSIVPNDEYYSLQWHLDNEVYGGIHAEAAWDMVTGDPNVVVGVVDTGVAYEDYVAPSFWHIDTYQAYSGSGHSWWCGVSETPVSWTGLYGSGSTPPGYGNGWKEYLQHAFDLSTATGTVTFSYQYRCHLENGYDFAYLDVSSDGGNTWTQLKSYTGPSKLSDVNWRSDSVNLNSYRGSEILIRFRVSTDEDISDEDYGAIFPPNLRFDSDGALFVDEITLTHSGGTQFYDNAESGPGEWVTTAYEQAPDLSGTSFMDGLDFVNQDAHPNDDNGHGTHVSGTIAQTTLNGFGVAGVAFGTTIMPVKVLNSAGTGSHEWIANGIHYAVDNGADVINLSLGGPGSDTLLEAVQYAYENGVVVVAASGNENGAISYPAAYDAYVIAVGATRYDETRSYYSNYGSSLDLVAPGGDTRDGVDQNMDGYRDGVLQNTFGNTTVDWAYWFWQGTSMATPHVSGVAALLLARNPVLTPDEVRSVLQSTAEDLGIAGWDSTYGWGLVDAEAALRSLAEPVHLMLAVDPSETQYAGGQSLALTVTVFNEMNPAFNSTLTLTITGPDGYYVYDSQSVKVAANEVKDYSFSWGVPDVAGNYIVEVGLVPTQLTACDATWLKVS